MVLSKSESVHRHPLINLAYFSLVPLHLVIILYNNLWGKCFLISFFLLVALLGTLILHRQFRLSFSFNAGKLFLFKLFSNNSSSFYFLSFFYMNIVWKLNTFIFIFLKIYIFSISFLFPSSIIWSIKQFDPQLNSIYCSHSCCLY